MALLTGVFTIGGTPEISHKQIPHSAWAPEGTANQHCPKGRNRVSLTIIYTSPSTLHGKHRVSGTLDDRGENGG